MEPGLVPGARLRRDEVNYRPLEKCGLCMHYVMNGHCDLVEGNIAPEAICSRYEIKPPESPYRDKEFYDKQYKKSLGNE